MNYYLPCFQKSSQTDEREPLLPKPTPSHTTHPSVERETTVIDKITNILVDLNTGKLPSQTQLSKFLQNLLSSQLLKQDHGNKTSGHGPLSKEGRKVLSDVRNLVQAMLQFGLEKNGINSFYTTWLSNNEYADDDKLQEIYFQISQINPSSLGETTATSVIDAVKEGAAKLDDQGKAISSALLFTINVNHP
jgi:hypothetical protein